MIHFEQILRNSSNCLLHRGHIQVTRMLGVIQDYQSIWTFQCILYPEIYVCMGVLLLGEEKEISIVIY
jgi:hypothetical protein